jgi:hypothetical protein
MTTLYWHRDTTTFILKKTTDSKRKTRKWKCGKICSTGPKQSCHVRLHREKTVSRQTLSRGAELQLRARNMSSHLEWAVEIQYVSRASLNQSDPIACEWRSGVTMLFSLTRITDRSPTRKVLLGRLQATSSPLELEGSLQCTQQPASRRYPGPDESRPHQTEFRITFNIFLLISNYYGSSFAHCL